MAPVSVFDEVTADVVLVREMEGLVVVVVGDFDTPEKERGSVGAAAVDVDVFGAGAPSMKCSRGHPQRLANHTMVSILWIEQQNQERWEKYSAEQRY